MKIRLDREQRDTIFPANIVLDNDLRVIALGPAIRGRFPEITQGASILDHFRLTASTNGTTIQELSGTASLLNLESHRSHQVLSGWVIPYQAGYLLALRLAPTNYSLEESGLQITDFAVGDPAVHALLMFSIQRALLKEQRLVALELDRARQLSQDLSERISRSAGFLAHDFNNFISIIKLNCDRLKMVLTGQERPLRLSGLGVMRLKVTRQWKWSRHRQMQGRRSLSWRMNLSRLRPCVNCSARPDLRLLASGIVRTRSTPCGAVRLRSCSPTSYWPMKAGLTWRAKPVHCTHRSKSF